MPDSPFKLFEPYGPEDQDDFFGRDGEIFALYQLLRQTRLALVYGASGAGKTSLIRAGLPKVFKLTDWLPVSVRRGDDLNQSLRKELARRLGPDQPLDPLPQAVQALYDTRWIPIYLVFDQFEEIFTLGDHAERLAFFRDLQQLLATDLPCKILLVMREEYIGHLYDYEPIVPTLFDKRFRVEPMQDRTVKEVIGSMCAAAGIGLEREPGAETPETPSTAAQILGQVKEGKQAVHLPYLQVYLHYLYGKAMELLRRPFFSEESIRAVGKLGNVLRNYIETRLEAAQSYLNRQGAPADLAQRLLDEFATDNGTRQGRRLAELAQSLQTPEPLVQTALSYFTSEAKLLRPDENEVDRYEPVHDVIARQIHELRSAEDKEFKAFARDLQLACRRWQDDQRPNDRLLGERDLNRAEVYRERLERRPEYQKEWKGFIAQSNEYHERLRTRRRWYTTGVTLIAIAAIVAAGFAFYLRGEAKQKQQEAEKAKEEAVANLKLYKQEELSRYILDAETYIISEDFPFAQWALDTAESIRQLYFPGNTALKDSISLLKEAAQ